MIPFIKKKSKNVTPPRRVGSNEQIELDRARENKYERVNKKPIKSGGSKKGFKKGRYILFAPLVIFVIFKQIPLFFEQSRILEKIAPHIEITGVKVSECKYLDNVALKKSVKIDSGTTFFSINLDSIENILYSQGGIESIESKINFKREVFFKIKERDPVAFLLTEGNIYLVDIEGFTWLFNPGDYWDIPVVTGLSLDTIKDENEHLKVKKDDLRYYKNVISLFINNKNRYNNFIVTEFDFSEKNRVELKISGIKPIVKIKRFPDVQSIQNINSLLLLLEQRDLDIKHYIDLSYNSVAFIK